MLVVVGRLSAETQVQAVHSVESERAARRLMQAARGEL